jgi:hypothetical protein
MGEGAVFRRVFNERAQRVGDQRLAARNVASVVKVIWQSLMAAMSSNACGVRVRDVATGLRNLRVMLHDAEIDCLATKGFLKSAQARSRRDPECH